MKTNKIFLLLIIVLITPLILATTFPGIPHQFYGNVSINGESSNTGTITTKINDEIVGEAGISNGKYGYEPIFFIEDPDYIFNGKKITFYINGINATTFIFENGATTRLNLEIFGYNWSCGNNYLDSGEECDDGNNINGDGCSTTCKIESTGHVCGNSVLEEHEECDNGTSNGVRCDNSDSSCTYCSSYCRIIDLGKEKDTNSKNKNNRQIELTSSCEPNWDCTNWGECSDGIMQRECKDTNNCAFAINKPLEEKACSAFGLVKLALSDKQDSSLLALLALSLAIIGILTVIVNRFF